MYQKTLGIVLRTIRYNDTSMIVDMYTNNFGRVAFISPISKSKRSSVKTNLFQPLSIIEFETDYRPNKTMQRLKDAKSNIPFTTIPYDIYKSAMAFFISEFLSKVIKEEEENKELFEYIMYSIMWLDNRKNNYSNFHLVFLVKLSRFVGLLPNTDNYQEGSFFDIRSSNFVATPEEIKGEYITPKDAVFINKLLRMNLDNMHVFRFNGEERNKCLSLMCDYYSIHIPNFTALKSLDVLREVFE